MELRDAKLNGDRLFASTRWSVVDGSENSRIALAELCRIYWQPIYLYLRRRGYQAADAQDLTQGFFVDLIATRFYLRADKVKGSFRAFLVGALKHFVADSHDHDAAQKRGGGAIRVPMAEAELVAAENACAGTTSGSADDLYDRDWAAALLRRTLERLEEESVVAGKGALFENMKPYLTANGDTDYARLSQRLGRPLTTLRSDMGRFRARYRAILREEVASIVADESEVDDELRHLCRVAAAH
jgi:RNA polymerase sigma-70 factor (ECF subfamily)